MSVFYILKKRIPLDIKMRLDAWKNPGEVEKWTKLARSEKQKVYIFLAGFYRNLGDMAITLAQKDFLQRQYPEAEIVWISNEDTYRAVRAIKKHISPSDLVTVIGGGNMGDSYIHLETERRYVVKSFPNNRVVLFPQTMFFHPTEQGAKELQKSKAVYEGHPNLVMFARERNSYKRMKEAFPGVKVCLAPDIVLSLDKREPALQRNGVLFCIRSDKESDLSEQERNAILSAVGGKYSKVTVTDTVDVSKEACTESRLETTLNDFWNRIKASELVVTDRLHCMIFCAITGTPCIAIDNANKKVSGVFEDWLKEYDNIHIVPKECVIPFIKDYRVGDSDIDAASVCALEHQFDALRETCVGELLW